MDALEQLRSAIPDAARDIRLNLQAVLRGGALTDAQRWSGGRRGGRRPRLREAVTSAASAAAGPAVVEDAKAAAALMAMNNRSEERRVGKECRSRWWPRQEKKKK